MPADCGWQLRQERGCRRQRAESGDGAGFMEDGRKIGEGRRRVAEWKRAAAAPGASIQRAAAGDRRSKHVLDIALQTRNNTGMKISGDNSLRVENFYAAWREQCQAVNLLRDGGSVPPEKLLQSIWLHQRLQRDRLQTADGRSVRVLHPGFASAEGGPDFRGAVLQFDNEPPASGDVEIDLQPSGWHAHGHDVNPNFKNVLLHVVWEETPGSKSAAQGPPARIALKQVLDAPPAELALALEHESGLPASLRGKCSAPLSEFAAPQLAELLHAAARVRFQNKAGAMLARARSAGWV